MEDRRGAAGYAGPGLLDSYSEERAPVAKRIVTRANKSSREFVGIFDAIGLTRETTTEGMQGALDELKAATPEGATKRAKLAEAMEVKNYEFNALGVELGQNYAGSKAVASDGTTLPEPTRDADLYYEPHTTPGVRLPHAWVGNAHVKVSTKDLAPYGSFLLLTGLTGQKWADAAQAIAAETGIPVEAVVIGPGQEYQDLYFDWQRLREVDEDGCVLVRPDKFVGWRSQSMVGDPKAALGDALDAILSR